MDSLTLGGLLVDAGCLSKAAVESILAQEPLLGATQVQAMLKALLVEHESVVAEVLSQRMQAPALVLSTSTLDLSALGLIPVALVRQYCVLPVLHDGASLTVAASKAELPGLIAPLEVATGRRVVVVVALEPLLRSAIEEALAAAAAGRLVLQGGSSNSTEPLLTIARAPLLPCADTVAKALGALLDTALDDERAFRLLPPTRTSIGALRLKQVRVAGPTAQPPLAVAESTPQAPRDRPLCLVVEDDDAIRALISRVLRSDDLEVEEAADGQAGAEALRRRRPDLIVLDAMLPCVHGFEICGAIKRSPHWCTVPIVMVSAVFKGFDSAKDIQEVHGADAFLEKPFEVNHLRHLAAELLKRDKPALETTAVQRLSADRARALVDHHLILGEVEAAGAVLDSWLSGDPFSARAWLERGNLALQAGDYIAALRAYELSSVYDAKLFIAHVSLAMLFEQLGFARRARATWEKAAANAPDPAMGVQIRAQLEQLRAAASPAG